MPATRPMAAADAQLFWQSATIANDQFLLYAFEGAPDRSAAAVGELERRARGCAELRLRVVDDHPWRYPRWVDTGVDPGQFVVQDDPADWQACLDAVARLAADPLDLRRMAWRAHVFTRVPGVGRSAGSVVVVQIAHALADGTRSAALAAALLGRAAPVPPVEPAGPAFLPGLVLTASRTHRRLQRDIEAGLVAPAAAPRPVLSVNEAPRGRPVIRTIALNRRELPGPTVTVGALVAIADALAGYLEARGEDPGRLGAEVPMTKPGKPQAHNHFRNVGVGLYPDLGRRERAARIATELAGHRRRAEHPAMGASDAASAAVPAALLRWGVGRFDPNRRSPVVTGNTVVSSVNRGAADLSFGGRPVVLTAGFPALSPMMSLTHGLHGIGDTVALSVHADDAVVDVDDYTERLVGALRTGGDALGLHP